MKSIIDAKKTLTTYTAALLLSSLSVFSNAECLPLTDLPEVINEGLRSDGDIFIDIDYFVTRISQGIELDAGGRVFFELSNPHTDMVLTSIFEDNQQHEGIFYMDKPGKDRFVVTDDYAFDITYFSARNNIFVMDLDEFIPVAEVPLPAAGFLFASALLGLGIRARRQ